jgi:hypothetical protein
MPQLEFEPTILISERAKTVYALDRAATVIGCLHIWDMYITIQINSDSCRPMSRDSSVEIAIRL